MRTLSLSFIFTAAFLLAGCATSPRQAYVKEHSDLPADHRRILLAGKINYSDPVVGMSKEEIRLTMGSAPAKIETIDGEEVWTWVREKVTGLADPWDATSVDSVEAGSNQAARSNGVRTSTMSAPEKRQVKTTVFFHGDRANRAQIDEEPL